MFLKYTASLEVLLIITNGVIWLRNMIGENITEITKRVEQAKKYSRYSQDVTVIAVSKTKPIEAIEEALNCGATEFGENRVQELKHKFEYVNEMNYNNIKWHMIGRLQKNKVKYVVGMVHLIHSVDNIELASEIQRLAEKRKVVSNILLQINVSGEKSKAGVKVKEVHALVDEILNYSNINIQGLMTMAPYTKDQKVLHQVFAKAKKTFDELKSEYQKQCDFKHLSMGMTNDFEIAIQEGSNMVRIGRAIFGDRSN